MRYLLPVCLLSGVSERAKEMFKKYLYIRR